MWTSSQSRIAKGVSESQADLGVVTVSARESGVYLGTERRWLPVMAPGGYRWRPRLGDQVLVLKTGLQGESGCILARQEDRADELLPGEVELTGKDCRVKLNAAGAVELWGDVTVNGVSLEQMIRTAAAQAVSQLASGG